MFSNIYCWNFCCDMELFGEIIPNQTIYNTPDSIGWLDALIRNEAH